MPSWWLCEMELTWEKVAWRGLLEQPSGGKNPYLGQSTALTMDTSKHGLQPWLDSLCRPGVLCKPPCPRLIRSSSGSAFHSLTA
jgi:hypothetical protein